MKAIKNITRRLVAGCVLTCCLVINTASNANNYDKFIGQSFSVLDTNVVANNDTNFYNALLAFPTVNSTNPNLQILSYGTNSLILRASHFDFSAETDRDFALAINDAIDTPLYANIDLLNGTNNQHGWLIQGRVSRHKVTDPMYLLIDNISHDYNGFFRAIPYSGPQIQLTGAQPNDTVSNIITLQADVSDLGSGTNEQLVVLVNGLPATYTLGTNNTINLDTRYAPNGTETVTVRAVNIGALLTDPLSSQTDNKTIYYAKTNLSLDFENEVYVAFTGDMSSPDVGTNYAVFGVTQPKQISATITEPVSGRVLATYSGTVSSPGLVYLPWDFTEADGVTPYTNDQYRVTFTASPLSGAIASNGQATPNDAGGSFTLSFLNMIDPEGVRTAGWSIFQNEAERPDNNWALWFDNEEQVHGEDVEYLYENLYETDWGTLTFYTTDDIGPNRDNPGSYFMPFTVDNGSQHTWANFLTNAVANRNFSDFNYGPGHSNADAIGGGPWGQYLGINVSWLNYVTTAIDAAEVCNWAHRGYPSKSAWRFRKAALWGCNTGLGAFGGSTYMGWPRALGIRDGAQQLNSWMYKNGGLFFCDELRSNPYGPDSASICEVIEQFEVAWVCGSNPWPGACDPTYSLLWAAYAVAGENTELYDAKPAVLGCPYMPFTGRFDDNMLFNNFSGIHNN